MLARFERIVHEGLGDASPLKWIGDEVMLAFDDCQTALSVLGTVLARCREEETIPLTRTEVHSGTVLRRGADVFGATVNVAARLTALAGPGELLTSAPMAEAACKSGVAVEDRGERQLRFVETPLRIYSIAMARDVDPRWIDPVCKMHAPLAAYARADGERWFCSPLCAAAHARNPSAYQA